MIQHTGIGTTSSISRMEAPLSADGTAANVTGALCTCAAGVAMSGCVFVIFTVGARGAIGSGKMLMRAVSFFGPAGVAAPE